MLADCSGAAWAPGHHVRAAVQPAVLPALLQHGPDHVVVFVRECEIAAAQLRQPQPTDDLFQRIGDRSRGSLYRHGLGWVFHQLLRKPAQVVRVVPVHPVAKANGLLGLHGRVAQDARLAFAHKLFETVVFDILLALEAHLLFDFHLDPQTLAVEPILVAQLAAAHRPEALEKILIGASPAMMRPHRVVGRDRSVDERPGWVVFVQVTQLSKGVRTFPEL